MKMNLLAMTVVFFALTGMGQALAGDAEVCLECHEPAEDWEGMSMDEILSAAKDAGNKRHKDNQSLTDEQLQALIAELLPNP